MAKESKITGVELTSDKIAEGIAKIYEAASLEMEKIIWASIVSGQLTNRVYYEKQRQEIIKIAQQTQVAATPIISEAVKRGYADGSEKAKQWLASFNGPPEKDGYDATDEIVIAAVLGGALSKLNDAIATMARRSEDAIRQSIISDLTRQLDFNQIGRQVGAERVLEALTRANLTTVKNVAEGPGKAGIRLITINGKQYNAAKYSEMVVKVASREAHTEATLKRLAENGQDIVQVTTHKTSCDICKQYDGQKYSISGETEGLPRLEATPPFHPNCRHLITGALKTGRTSFTRVRERNQ